MKKNSLLIIVSAVLLTLVASCTKEKENDNVNNDGYVEPTISGKVFRNAKGNLFRVYGSSYYENYEEGEVTDKQTIKKMLMYELDWNEDTLIGIRTFDENQSYTEYQLSYRDGILTNRHSVFPNTYDIYFIRSNDSLYITDQADSTDLYLYAILKDGKIVKRPRAYYKTYTNGNKTFADVYYEYDGENCVKQSRKFDDNTEDVFTYEYTSAVNPLNIIPTELGFFGYVYSYNLCSKHLGIYDDGDREENKTTIKKEENGKITELLMDVFVGNDHSGYRLNTTYTFDYSIR